MQLRLFSWSVFGLQSSASPNTNGTPRDLRQLYQNKRIQKFEQNR